MIKYILDNDKYFKDYVVNYTNASYILGEKFDYKEGLFSGFDAQKRAYDSASWAFAMDEKGFPKKGNDEVNRVPRRANMGWPIEGNCAYTNNPAYVRPLYYFPGPGLPALTGIVVYRATAFPRLRGKILFTGNSSPTVWTLTLTADGDTILPNSFSTLFTYSTGFADIEVGPDGALYITNGPYSANRILHLRPVAPSYASSAPTTATQGVLYSYMPTFSGTPPDLRIISGPEGMYFETTTWTVRWIPTNQQALQHQHDIVLRAENGAGTLQRRGTR